MDRLTQDQVLNVGDTLLADDASVSFIMQGDGNAVLYRARDGRPLWASNTAGRPVTHLIMQGDGNLVAYTADGQAEWASGTDGHPGASVVLQDDGNLVVYDAGGRALWASNTVQARRSGRVPGFLPSTNAPLFANGPWPTGTKLSLSMMGLPPVSINATTMGLCGGMSFLTRDIVESGTPQLRGRVASAVPMPVAQHLLSRLITSFSGVEIVAKWLQTTAALDADSVVWGKGLYSQTVGECNAIMAEIDAGRLCPIGLVLVHSYAPWDVFKNHVVLVWGYDLDGESLTLRTYDCNRPGRDDIVVSLDLSTSSPVKTISTNGTDGEVAGRIRGLFRVPYQHADPAPAYVDDATVSVGVVPTAPLPPGGEATVAIDATNTGSTTWSPASGYRLGSQAPQDNVNWGTNRVELPAGPVDPGQSVRFAFAIRAADQGDQGGPAGTGDTGFAWQMMREDAHWFGRPCPTVTILLDSAAVSAPAGPLPV